MDIPEAIELIKKAIADEIPHLKGLHYQNYEFELWGSKMYDILRAAFGEGSREYQGFFLRGAHGVRIHGSEKDYQNDYVQNVEGHEQALKEIVQRYEVVGIRASYVATAKLPKAFIAHGGNSSARTKLCEFLEALKVTPIIAEKAPSENRSVNEQVDWCLAQSDCAIVLATKGDIDGRTGNWIARGNILIEIGKVQERFPRKTVYLLEEGATFPTNVSEKVWERFTHECMDRALIKVAKELTAFDIIRAVKPSQ